MKHFRSIGIPEIQRKGLLVLSPGHAAPDPQTGVQFNGRFLAGRIQLQLAGTFPLLTVLTAVRFGFPPFLVRDDFFPGIRLLPRVIYGSGSHNTGFVIQQVLRVCSNRNDRTVRETVRQLVLHQEVDHGAGLFDHRAFIIHQRCIQHHAHRQFIALVQDGIIKLRGQHQLFVIHKVTGHPAVQCDFHFRLAAGILNRRLRPVCRISDGISRRCFHAHLQFRRMIDSGFL